MTALLLKSNVRFLSIMSIALLIAFSSCNKEDDPIDEPAPSNQYGIFTVADDGMSASVSGTIVDASLSDFRMMLAAHPNIKTLNLVEIDGSDVSSTDSSDGSLDLGRAVYNANLNTHLVDNGDIASGGTDLFASGRHTSVGSNPTIGVHSWGGGWDGNPDGQGWDIKDNSSHFAHRSYILFFQDIGFGEPKATDFYFYTIHAAKAEDMHEMSMQEINLWLIR